MANDVDGVRATRTSFRVLEALAEDDGRTVTELAEALDLSKSGVHKHLTTLASLGYLRRTNGRYHLGCRFLTLGMHARKSIELYRAARDDIDRLAETTELRVELTCRDRDRAVTVYSVSGGSDRRGEEGRSVPLLESGPGKVIVAHQPRSEQESMFADRERGRRELLRDLETVRDRRIGFSDEGERNVVAVPVLNRAGFSIGAVSVAGPHTHMRGRRFEEDVPGMLISLVTDVETRLSPSE